MQPLSLNEIREKFLDFFVARDHLRLPSFPLIPHNDPSLLLINAGMTPLKPYFTGAQKPPALRVTTCQKCIRTPDIERVGQTARHGTFFEMLGNFSFGDYFKKEAITWAWEFCTEVLAMPAQRLFVSIYEDDDEAFDIWHETVGLAKDRIYRMGKEDNFWEHGVGPCGPCSEIFFDRGPSYGCDRPDCSVGCDCDRFVEFWNLVFTQFNREEDGSYTPLKKKNIDTGAGLERLAAIMQDVDNLFEVDTIRSIIDHACRLAGVTYGQTASTDMAIRVITDHIRSTSMLIADGVIPSNEDRGYVLRRLLRRAARYGKLLGLTKPFLFALVPTVVQESGEAYPELKQNEKKIVQVIRKEEERFLETIQQGSVMLEQMIARARAAGVGELSGGDVFRLHDTFGFPFDLTREIAAEQGLAIAEDEFNEEMERQKATARKAFLAKTDSAWDQGSLPEAVKNLAPTVFSGYDVETDQAQIVKILSPGPGGLNFQEEITAGTAAVLILDRTPFYAESGGQIGDSGQITAGPDNVFTVSDTVHTAEGIYLHHGVLDKGRLMPEDLVQAEIDHARRLSTARNHTATHLLHKSLRQVLGEHVTQAGSFVAADRFRFDFSHYQPLTADEKKAVEELINQVVLQNKPVRTRVMSLAEARTEGAQALFGEKYGDTVRVVSVESFSKELCGGTHVGNTAQIGQFRLLSENGIASGVRRIEGITGTASWQMAKKEQELLEDLGHLLKTRPVLLTEKVEQLLDEVKTLEQQQKEISRKQRSNLAAELVGQAVPIGGIPTLTVQVEAADVPQLRALMDQVRDRMGEHVLVMAAETSGKVAWVAAASPEAVRRGVHAGQLIGQLARITGGGGGGRPQMAQAGGTNPAQIAAALAEGQTKLKELLGD